MKRDTRVSRRTFVQRSASAAALASMPSIVSSRAVFGQESGKPALLGGEPAMKGEMPEWPVIGDSDREYFKDALERKAWCRLYDDIATQFEEAWAKSLGAKYAIGVVNGTNALYAGLNAVGVEPGDEVIVPPYTFVATVNAVVQQFALPVFADSDIETFQIDTDSIEGRITDNTKCLLPVHFGGMPVDMDGIAALSQKHGIPVVEDACQSHFGEWKGKCVGGLGDVGCFSHQSTKILPCGEGGSAVTNDEAVYNKLHAFQNNGRDPVTGTRDGYIHQGSNLRITEYQAALLLTQLERLDDQCKLREANADYLTEMLAEVPGVEPAKMYDGCTRNTYYLYMVRVIPEQIKGLSKNQFLKALREEGVGAWSGYRPLNKEPFLKTMLESRGYRRLFSEKRLKDYWEQNECPKNDVLCEQGFFMPHNHLLGTKEDMEKIAMAVKKIYHHADALKNA